MNKIESTKINNSIIQCLLDIPAKQFSLLASLIGISLTEGLSIDEQNAIGNFLLSAGQSVLTAAAQAQIKNNSK